MDEQVDRNSLETECRYCGSGQRGEPRTKHPEHYQVVVSCAECGNVFASISRN